MSECWECKKDEEIDCMCIVSCDSDCKALKNPRTLEEYEKSFEHWRGHGYLSGCSHGC